MGDRLLPWRSKPSQATRALFESLCDVRLYVVHRAGPTAFHLQETSEGPVIKVVLGGRHTCSCKAEQTSEVCIHIAFAIVKVLKVSPENPLAWQLGLVDRELESVLSCSALGDRTIHNKRSQPKKKLAHVIRKPLDQEDPCPICFEDMQKSSLRDLVYCRNGCGRNVHGLCLRIWSEHQRSKKAQLSCPLCRSDWGEFRWLPVSEKSGTRQRSPQKTGSPCSNCKITSEGFHCLTCRSFSLCPKCFEAGCHMEHKFARDKDPLEAEVPRDDMMPCCTAILDATVPLVLRPQGTAQNIPKENLHSNRPCKSAPGSQKASLVYGRTGNSKKVRKRGGNIFHHPDSRDMKSSDEKEDALDKHIFSIFGEKCSIHRAGEL